MRHEHTLDRCRGGTLRCERSASRPADAQGRLPRRTFGIGTTVGVSLEQNNLGIARESVHMLSLSLHVSLSYRVELEAWLPLANMLFARFTDGSPGVLWACLRAGIRSTTPVGSLWRQGLGL